MLDTAYLKQRRRGWYVQLAVPLALQEIVGAKVLTRSLATRDLTEARKRRHAVLAELQQMLAGAAKRPFTGPPKSSDLIDTASLLLEAEARGESTEDNTEAAFDAAVDAHLAKEAK